jgi:hypothetical protein
VCMTFCTCAQLFCKVVPKAEVADGWSLKYDGLPDYR